MSRYRGSTQFMQLLGLSSRRMTIPPSCTFIEHPASIQGLPYGQCRKPSSIFVRRADGSFPSQRNSKYTSICIRPASRRIA
jgi:hypothetical protein